MSYEQTTNYEMAQEPAPELLLTSAGPTTEPIQERLFDMAHAINPSQRLRVLRIADGWQRFSKEDEVPLVQRYEHRAESIAANAWSARYISHVLGPATLETYVVGALNEDQFATVLQRADMVLVPGGNTWLTMRGLLPHRELLAQALRQGRAYVGESAGSIAAGRSSASALLEPADAAPKYLDDVLSGLGLVDFDLVVHAAGREGSFDIPGPLSFLASRILKSYETPSEQVQIYVDQGMQRPVLALNDKQAVSVSQGQVTII